MITYPLIQEALDGDSNAAKKVHTWLAYLVKNIHKRFYSGSSYLAIIDVEDLTQWAFTYLYTVNRTCNGKDKSIAYFEKSIRRETFRYLTRNAPVVAHRGYRNTVLQQLELLDIHIDKANPEVEILLKDVLEIYTPFTRKILILYYLYNYNTVEISQIFDCHEETIRRRMRKELKKRRAVDERWGY
jgi:RNA polymerase sigma factor (sigma-70 family)